MLIVDFVFLLLGVLTGVAFFTLFERKLLSYSHFRKGPSKVFILGVSQPFGDAVKLFFKEFVKSYKYFFYLFTSGPLLAFFLMVMLWSSYVSFVGVWGSYYLILYIFCFLSLGVYIFIFCGWSSESSYSMVGSFRAISQSISYEVILFFMVFFFLFFVHSYDLALLLIFQKGFWLFFVFFMFFLCWFYSCLAESNRTPFDFSESESELVSGFNVEYGGGLFSLIFIYEYGMIIFLSFTCVLFFGGGSDFFFKLFFMCFIFVAIRSSYPRFRYDFLLVFSWKKILPFVLSVLFLVLCFF